jgi:DNA-binding transcriptional ArsR family regulator
VSRGLGRTQRAVLEDLKRRHAAGEHPLTTKHIAGLTRSAVSRAYTSLEKRGLIELRVPKHYRVGNGLLVRLKEETPG